VGEAYAPFPAICGYLMGIGAGECGMSVGKLPSGRWRAQVYDPATGKNLSVSGVLGGPGTFATKTEAKQARERARERLGAVCARHVTVRAFWERWTTDPLFARPKESSDIRRRELTKSFAERYGDIPIRLVGDEIVADWLAGGGRAGSVQGLCSMFNDAASVKAGRLIDRNPFQKLGISRGRQTGVPVVRGLVASRGFHGPASG
jgi:hypothetical protein